MRFQLPVRKKNNLRVHFKLSASAMKLDFLTCLCVNVMLEAHVLPMSVIAYNANNGFHTELLFTLTFQCQNWEVLVWFCRLVRSTSHPGVVFQTQLWQIPGTTPGAKQSPPQHCPQCRNATRPDEPPRTQTNLALNVKSRSPTWTCSFIPRTSTTSSSSANRTVVVLGNIVLSHAAIKNLVLFLSDSVSWMFFSL